MYLSFIYLSIQNFRLLKSSNNISKILIFHSNFLKNFLFSFLAHEFDARRRMISKTFYQQLRSSERQSLVGPPENMREHVVAASKAMRNGNWRACKTFIINDKMNAKVINKIQTKIFITLCSGMGLIPQSRHRARHA